MRPNLSGKSLLLLCISIVFLILYTLFESALSGLSTTVERIITFLFLVLPATIGVVFGIMSLIRKEGRALWVLVITLLNTLFALFHVAIIIFAG
jgi:hypothetical protein